MNIRLIKSGKCEQQETKQQDPSVHGIKSGHVWEGAVSGHASDDETGPNTGACEPRLLALVSTTETAADVQVVM